MHHFLHSGNKTGGKLFPYTKPASRCAIRLLPILEIPTWLWIWAGVIVFIKIVNQASALVVHNRFCFPHASANKVTGLLLFLSAPTMFWSVIPIAIVAAVATFAAVQEGLLNGHLDNVS